MVRLKHRYVLAELRFSDPKMFYSVNPHRLMAAIQDVVALVHGKTGVAGVGLGLHIRYLNEYSKLVLIRVRSQFHQNLLTALPFIKTLPVKLAGKGKADNEVACFLNTLAVTGTIRDTQKKIRTYDMKTMDKLVSECKTEEERNKVLQAYASTQQDESEEDEEEENDG